MNCQAARQFFTHAAALGDHADHHQQQQHGSAAAVHLEDLQPMLTRQLEEDAESEGGIESDEEAAIQDAFLRHIDQAQPPPPHNDGVNDQAETALLSGLQEGVFDSSNPFDGVEVAAKQRVQRQLLDRQLGEHNRAREEGAGGGGAEGGGGLFGVSESDVEDARRHLLDQQACEMGRLDAANRLLEWRLKRLRLANKRHQYLRSQGLVKHSASLPALAHPSTTQQAQTTQEEPAPAVAGEPTGVMSRGVHRSDGVSACIEATRNMSIGIHGAAESGRVDGVSVFRVWEEESDEPAETNQQQQQQQCGGEKADDVAVEDHQLARGDIAGSPLPSPAHAPIPGAAQQRPTSPRAIQTNRQRATSSNSSSSNVAESKLTMWPWRTTSPFMLGAIVERDLLEPIYAQAALADAAAVQTLVDRWQLGRYLEHIQQHLLFGAASEMSAFATALFATCRHSATSSTTISQTLLESRVNQMFAAHPKTPPQQHSETETVPVVYFDVVKVPPAAPCVPPWTVLECIGVRLMAPLF
ncbi:unnamed protein product [Vitrella brassicaformis CCMP3155]|uniref:Uncharacterized protein n=1 Tax=Vitrella brassicaformis (strain CCMP3155) TaxID=1169540 RepID=A0A0G4GUJ4_VITBC|nr:unnamed protein product [Vitrella brassicaformis CCMP3155]|eukprot:CEM34484.1 unnamed protein product [Vitrella brassicaformis CCMP3155]